MNNDLISREALKKDIDKFIGYLDEDMICRIKVVIDNAPTVEGEILTKEAYSDLCLRASRERPQGEWIMNKTSARGRNYTCTSCKKVSRNKFNFCPNCGAKMDLRGENE